MDFLQVGDENKRQRKSSSRRSSILKIERQTLADLDVNKEKEEKTSRRSSKRVSFAETYQVKEFPKDSPQQWLKNIKDLADESFIEEKSSDANKGAGGEIQGLDQLLNGEIQTNDQENGPQSFNKTTIESRDMDETTCVDSSIRQNTTLSHRSTQDRPSDVKTFLNSILRQPSSDEDDLDDEEYKASSFFRGGSEGFGNQNDDKINGKNFLSKLATLSKRFGDEKDNLNEIFDGLDGDTDMIIDFTATLQDIKKRKSVGNVLESTNIGEDLISDAVELTSNITRNVEVVKSNFSTCEFEEIDHQPAPKREPSVMERSSVRGLEQTRVFSDYQDPTCNMDFTVAEGKILGESGKQTHGTDSSNVNVQMKQTGTVTAGLQNKLVSTPAQNIGPASPEVTLCFGNYKLDADMEMTEALDPTIVLRNARGTMTTIKPAQNLDVKIRALTDVTAHFEGDGLTIRKEELVVPVRRSSSLSPAEMDKENVLIHPKHVESVANEKGCQKSCPRTAVINQSQIFSKDEESAVTELKKCQTQTNNLIQRIGQESEKKMMDSGPSSENSVQAMSSELEKTKVSKSDTSVQSTGTKLKTDLESGVDYKVTVSSTGGKLRDSLISRTDIVTRSSTVSPERTKVCTSSGGDMEMTTCQTGLISTSGKQSPDKTKMFTSSRGDMEMTTCQTGLISTSAKQSPDKTKMFTSSGGAMELTTCQTGLISTSAKPSPDKTKILRSSGGAMELTTCQTGLISTSAKQSPDKTKVFPSSEGAMELTTCHTGLISTSAKQSPDKTKMFPSSEGAMELTTCQTGLISAPMKTDVSEATDLAEPVPGNVSLGPTSMSEKTRLFKSSDTTAAMEMTQCHTSSLPTETETLSEEQKIQEEVHPMPEEPVRRRSSVPGKDFIRQSLSGASSSVALQSNLSTHNLKRKLYSFEMMMAGAKAKTVKVAKLSSNSEHDKGAADRSKTITTALDQKCEENKIDNRTLSQSFLEHKTEVSDGTPVAAQDQNCEANKTDIKTVSKSFSEVKIEVSANRSFAQDQKNAADGIEKEIASQRYMQLKTEVSADRSVVPEPGSPNKSQINSIANKPCADPNSFASSILKQSTTEGELSALEMLKLVALDEDTDMIDDTKLHMLAKKNKQKENSPGQKTSPSSLNKIEKTSKDFNEMAAKACDDDHLKLIETIASEEPPPHFDDITDITVGDLNATGCNQKSKTAPESVESEKRPPIEDTINAVTSGNTNVTLALLISKVGKLSSKDSMPEARTAPVNTESAEQAGSPGSHKLVNKSVLLGKHPSPDPPQADRKKRAKLGESSILGDKSEEKFFAVLSESVMSLSRHSLLADSTASKEPGGCPEPFYIRNQDDNGCWDFDQFCQKMVISHFCKPSTRRSSINIVQHKEPESLEEALLTRAVTVTETSVKQEVYERLSAQLESDEAELHKQIASVSEQEPALFQKLRAGEISQEQIQACHKACGTLARARHTQDRLDITTQCLRKLQEEKERLSAGMEEILHKAELVISDKKFAESMLADINQQLKDLGSQQTDTELNETECVRERLQLKTGELKEREDHRDKLIHTLQDKKREQQNLELECLNQELQLLQCEQAPHNAQMEDMRRKVEALERVTEWRVKSLSPAQDTFLFFKDTLRLTVQYDVVQHTTITSISLNSLASESLPPWCHLAVKLVLDAVDETKLRDCHPKRENLPQMLDEISGVVASARNTSREISHIALRHRVCIAESSVTVSLLNTQKVRKAVLQFQFDPDYMCLPASCSIDVILGDIQKEKIDSGIREIARDTAYISRCISIAQYFLDS